MCKKVLVIEDNEPKLNKLKQFCSDYWPGYQMECRCSYNTALSEVVHHGKFYDIILLDVSMNTYEVNGDASDGEQEPLAGSNILRFMKLRKINVPVIVVTMYESFVDGIRIDKLDEGFRTRYPEFYKGYVYYSLKNDEWINKLNELMAGI